MDEKLVVARYSLRLFAPDGTEVARRVFNVWKQEPPDVMDYQIQKLARELCRDALLREGKAVI